MLKKYSMFPSNNNKYCKQKKKKVKSQINLSMIPFNSNDIIFN